MGIRDISYRVRDSLMLFGPDINPKYVSLVSVLVSIPVLFFKEPLTLAIIIFIILYLDSLDGHIARKYNRRSKEGHITDIAGDRFSELLIFFFNPFLLMLVYINIMLSIYNVKKETYILPLRHVYLLYLVYLVLVGL